jgi:hypothetical protein
MPFPIQLVDNIIYFISKPEEMGKLKIQLNQQFQIDMKKDFLRVHQEK